MDTVFTSVTGPPPFEGSESIVSVIETPWTRDKSALLEDVWFATGAPLTSKNVNNAGAVAGICRAMTSVRGVALNVQ
jgi:hypothetical protein